MPKVVYSLEERLELVKLREQGVSYRRIVDYFAAGHPGRPIPSTSTVQDIMKKYYKTGQIDATQTKYAYPSRQISEEQRFDICLMAEEEPDKPCSEIARELGVSKSTVWLVLRLARTRKYKSRKPENPLPLPPLPSPPTLDETQPIFSQTMLERLNADESYLRRVCFANECSVLLVSKPYAQYIRVCPWRIQYLVKQPAPEYQKLHVWTGIVGKRFFGPFFIEGTLDGNKYLKMLREEIVPALRASEEDSPVIWYKQDHIPPHYTPEVWTYLWKEFPHRWIGRYGPIQRPNSSFDISLLDLALWGRLKNILREREEIENLSTLRQTMKGIFCKMDSITVCGMIRASYDRGLRLETQE